MPANGRYTQFRHAFPEFFGPGIQTQRGLLRLRWLLLGNVDYRPVWTIGVSAGLVGMLLTIALFVLPTEQTVVAAMIPGPPPAQQLPAPPPIVTPPQNAIPYPRPLVELVASMKRVAMPFGWDDRRMAVVMSPPPEFKPDPYAAYSVRDGWQLASTRPITLPQPFIPYREPTGLRQWDAETPLVKVGPQANPLFPNKIQPGVQVDKRAVPAGSQPGLLKYELIVRNIGTKPVPEVKVIEALDVRRVTQVDPPALVEQNGLTWRLGSLAPLEERRLTFSLSVENQPYASSTTEVELADQFSSVTEVAAATPYYQQPPAVTPPQVPRSSIPANPPRSSIPAQPPVTPAPQPAPQPVYRPILHLRSRAPEGGVVGQDVSTWYEVTNSGNAAAVEVMLSIDLPAGLRHHDGATTVNHRIARIEPGESRQARLVTRIEAAGAYRLDTRLTSGDISERQIVEVTIPMPLSPVPGSSMWSPMTRRQDNQIVQAGLTTPQEPMPQWLPSSGSAAPSGAVPRSSIPSNTNPATPLPASPGWAPSSSPATPAMRPAVEREIQVEVPPFPEI